jgi:hypothetical protein
VNAKTPHGARLLGIAPAPESDPTPESDSTPGVPWFDGGARQSPPLPPASHGEWLAKVIRGEVAVLSDWPWPHG